MKLVHFYAVSINHKQYSGLNDIFPVTASSVMSAEKKVMRFIKKQNPDGVTPQELKGYRVNAIAYKGTIIV